MTGSNPSQDGYIDGTVPVPSKEKGGRAARLFAVDESPGEVANVVTTRMCVYAESAGLTLPRRFVGQAARQLKRLAEEGFDESVLGRAAELMLDRGMNPAVLPSLVVSAQARGLRRYPPGFFGPEDE